MDGICCLIRYLLSRPKIVLALNLAFPDIMGIRRLITVAGLVLTSVVKAQDEDSMSMPIVDLGYNIQQATSYNVSRASSLNDQCAH